MNMNIEFPRHIVRSIFVSYGFQGHIFCYDSFKGCAISLCSYWLHVYIRLYIYRKKKTSKIKYFKYV